jgi:hypothetical protein
VLYARHARPLWSECPPWISWQKPHADGNRVVARRGGKEPGGETATRGEYLGAIVLIAAILAAIASTGIGGKLTDLIEEAIDKVFQSQD